MQSSQVISANESRISKLEEMLKVDEAMNEELNVALEDAHILIEKRDADIQLLESEYTKALEEQAAMDVEQKANISRLMEELAIAGHYLEGAGTDVEILERKNMDLNKEIVLAEAHVEDLEKEALKMKAEHDQVVRLLDDRLALADITIKQGEAKLLSMQGVVETLSNELSSANSAVEDRDVLIVSLEKDQAEIMRELQAEMVVNIDLATKLQQAENKSSAIDALKVELLDSQSDFEKLQVALAATQLCNREINEELTASLASLQDAENSLSLTQSCNRELNSELTASLADFEACNNKLTSMEKLVREAAAHQASVAQLTEELHTSGAKTEEWASKLQIAESDFARIVNNMNEKLTASDLLSDRYKNELAVVESNTQLRIAKRENEHELEVEHSKELLGAAEATARDLEEKLEAVTADHSKAMEILEFQLSHSRSRVAAVEAENSVRIRKLEEELASNLISMQNTEEKLTVSTKCNEDLSMTLSDLAIEHKGANQVLKDELSCMLASRDECVSKLSAIEEKYSVVCDDLNKLKEELLLAKVEVERHDEKVAIIHSEHAEVVASLHETVADHTESIEELESKSFVEMLMRDCDTDEALVELREALTKSDTLNVKLSEDLQALENDYDSVCGELEEALASVEANQRAYESNVAMLEQHHEASVQHLKTSMRDRNPTLDTEWAESQEMIDALSTARSRIRELTSDLSTTQSIKELTINDLSRAEINIAQLNTRLSAAKASVEQLNMKLGAINCSKGDDENAVNGVHESDQTACTAQLISNVVTVQSIVQETFQELSFAQSVLEDREAKLMSNTEHFQLAIQQLSGKLISAESKLQAVVSETDVAQENATLKKASCETSVVATQQLTIEMLTAQLSTAQQNIDKRDAKLEVYLKAQNIVCQELKKQMLYSQAELNSLKSKLSVAQNALQNKKGEGGHVSSVDENEQYKGIVTELRGQLLTTDSKLRGYEVQFASMNDENNVFLES